MADTVPPTEATPTPVQAQFTSPFIGNTPQELAQVVTELDPRTKFFVVLDERSASEDSVDVVMVDVSNGVLETVRVAFGKAQVLLTALDVGSLGWEEIGPLAEEQGGVYGAGASGADTTKQGSSSGAPRKLLGT